MVAAKSKPQDQSPSTPPQFSHASTKIAVAQICRSIGFKRFQPSALEALTKITTCYLQSLAKSAASSASIAGRTQSNLLDVVCALEELASPIGFPDASRAAESCFLSSGALRDVRSFVRNTVELPFAKPMPVREDDRLSAANLGVGDDRRRRMEIPPWLPEFPDVKDEEIGIQERRELYWEEKKVEKEECLRHGVVKELDKRRNRLPFKRDRVKFRVSGKTKGNIGRRK